MTKKQLIIGIVVAAAIVLAVTAYFVLNPPEEAPKPAALSNVTGTVFVDSGQGYRPASEGAEIKLGDKVKTGPNSNVTIIFYDSSIMNLGENTEIEVNSLSSSGDQTSVGVKQNSGTTWNRVLSLAGQTNYDVQTPNTVATVRGTGFLVDVGDNESVFVSDGNVSVKNSGQELSVLDDQAVQFDGPTKTIKKRELKKDWITYKKARLQEDLAYLRQLKVKRIRQLLAQHKFIVARIKARYNMTDEQFIDTIQNTSPDQYEQKFGIAGRFVPAKFRNFMKLANEKEAKLTERLNKP